MKRKIITDQNSPLAQENPKDFSELLSQYSAAQTPVKPINSSFKWLGAAAAAGIIILGTVFFFDQKTEPKAESNDQTPSQISETQQTENSNFNLPSWSYVISTKTACTLVSPKGVVLEIPAHAFSDANGQNPDSVELELTHYDDIASILHSQIPMNYDSAGVEYHFQTDGMFQLLANAAGENITLNKEITIHYPQSSGIDGMNTYAFTNGAWSYEGSSPLTNYEEVCKETVYRFNKTTPPLAETSEEKTIKQKIKNLTNHSNELLADISNLEKTAPLEPKKQNLNNYRFTLDVKPEEFPELTHFDDVVFEVKDSRFSFNIYEETWNDISVKKSPKEGRYLITLKNIKRVEIFDVYPVLTENQYASALETYSQKKREIELKKKDKRLKIKQNKQIEKDFLAKLETYQALKIQKSAKEQMVDMLTSELTPESPYRTISIGNLGIINFDKPLTILKKGMALAAAFVIKKSPLPVNAVSLIDTKDKKFYSWRKEDFSDFRIPKGKDYLIVSVLPNGQIATYKTDLDSDQFKKGERHRFELELAPEYTSIDELKNFLGLSVVDA